MQDSILADTYNGETKRLVNGECCFRISESNIPYLRPSKTIVLEFSDTSYDPTADTWKTGATWTQLSATPNVWEYYRNDTDWHSEFDSKFTSASNNVSVVEFDGTGIIDMRAMFMGCTMLSSVADFSVPDATMASSIFYGCTGLSTLSLSFPSCSTYSYAFYGCTSLTSATVSDLTSATNFEYAFGNCTSLTSVTVGTPTSGLVNTSHTFSGCTAMTGCQGAALAEYATDTSYMYDGCSGITSLSAAPSAAYSNNVDYMYRNCINCASGQYSKYLTMSGRTTPPSSHTGTFTNCGSNSTAGQTELARIPLSWGGTYVVTYSYTLKVFKDPQIASQPTAVLSICALTGSPNGINIDSGTWVHNGSSTTLSSSELAQLTYPKSAQTLTYTFDTGADYLEVNLTALSPLSSLSWSTYEWYAQNCYLAATLYRGGTYVGSTNYYQYANTTYTITV